MPRRFSHFVIALCLTAFTSLAQEQSITPKHSRHFTRYEGCEFGPTKYADGDSFKVRIGADEFVLRLYFVDAPESDERFPDRNAEQAKYFGITQAKSVEAGKAAKEFVSGRLTGKKFVAFTCWATALGSSKLPRYYAIIEVDGRGLADLLVENGLARLHGTSVTHPDGRSAKEYIESLVDLEKVAKEERIGAWAKSRPEMQHPTVEETMEPSSLVAQSLEWWHQIPRWLERLSFVGVGAGLLALSRFFSERTRKRREIAATQKDSHVT